MFTIFWPATYLAANPHIYPLIFDPINKALTNTLCQFFWKLFTIGHPIEVAVCLFTCCKRGYSVKAALHWAFWVYVLGGFQLRYLYKA
jgi:hypothetical protein